MFLWHKCNMWYSTRIPHIYKVQDRTKGGPVGHLSGARRRDWNNWKYGASVFRSTMRKDFSENYLKFGLGSQKLLPALS
jgi:hypothetical protein